MRIKTSELTGQALDWAVAHAGVPLEYIGTLDFSPSTNWVQCGPIIEREGISISNGYNWEAVIDVDIEGGDTKTILAYGPTPLIAAMRCYCCAILGDEVDIPEELV